MTKRDVETSKSLNHPGLSEDLSKLGKPAQRALLSNGISTPEDLAKRTLEEVLDFHGIGKSSVPILLAALQKKGMRFRKAPKPDTTN
jgi:hypothetical protein